MQKGQTDRRRALDHLDRHRTAHLQLRGGSLGASSEVARSAPAELPVAVGQAACLEQADRSRRAVVLESGRTAMDTFRAAQASEWFLRGRYRRVRRASIANVEYRTPDLYHEINLGRTQFHMGKGVNLPS